MNVSDIIYDALAHRNPLKTSIVSEAVLDDLGADALMRHTVAMEIGDEFGTEPTEAESMAWVTVSDVEDYVAALTGG